MTLAPLPDSGRNDSPRWRTYLHAYRHVIAPLRHNGWTTDLDITDDDAFIRCDLGTGTELIITSTPELPANPQVVAGWSVMRQPRGSRTHYTCIYDSTPGGAHADNEADLLPLFEHIDALDVPKPGHRLTTSAAYTSPTGAHHLLAADSETPAMAVSRFYAWSKRLTGDEGYRGLWERPETDGYPMAVFERLGHVTTVRVTRSSD
ncbi:hypothetical protein [Streptomyces sp. NPDC014733]|uniref:hypothetical protein n=1 Tax=Streptomyces sp. NPDC014733 TaxID=3364885 RepID=UPI0037001DEC